MKNGIQFLLGLLFAAAAVGQTPTFNILYSFPYTAFKTTIGGYSPNGTMPNGPLLQASDGNFYGTTMLGGDDGQCSKPPSQGNPVPQCAGTVFQLTPVGKLTVLHVFSWEGITTPYARTPMAARREADWWRVRTATCMGAQISAG